MRVRQMLVSGGMRKFCTTSTVALQIYSTPKREPRRETVPYVQYEHIHRPLLYVHTVTVRTLYDGAK